MKEVRSDLKAYLDKELSPERMEEIKLALEEDSELREEAEFYQLLSRSIVAAAKSPEVVGMDQAVSKTLKSSEKKGISFPKLALPQRGWQAAGAVAVVGILCVIFFPIFAQAKNAAKRSAEFTGGISAKEAVAGEAMAASPAFSAPMDGAMSERAKSVQQGLADQVGRSRGSLPAESGKAESRQGFDKSPRPNSDASSVVPVQSNRLITRSADMTVRVKQVSRAASEAERIAQRFGGYVESSNVNSDPQNPSASLSLRIASSRWVAATQAIRDLGIVLTESSSGDDVTAQVYDLEARVKTLRAEEESLRIILSKAYRLGDILQVKDRISQVRMEIESMTGQAKQLRNLAALSTVTLTLTQEPKVDDETKPDPWMEDSWTNAVNSLQSVLKTVGSFLTYVVVFAPLWLPVMLVAWLIVRKASKSSS